MPIKFSSPRAQPEVVHFFLYQIKAHIFLVANPKFQLQILCSFGDMTKNVKFIGIPENNFLCFHNSLITRGAYFLLSLESKQEATSRVKLHKMHFRGQGQSIQSEKYKC